MEQSQTLPSAIPVPPVPAAPHEELAHRAAKYARHTVTDSTTRAYEKDWPDFAGWCTVKELVALPATPATVGMHLTSLADRLAVATLTRRLAAISTKHRLAGHQIDTKAPQIHDLMRGIRREHGTAQRRVAPATTPLVQAMVATCDESLIGRRDRALLLVGFAAALRRSELVVLNVAEFSFVSRGMTVLVARSKTVQEQAGQSIGVVQTGTATCPVATLQGWLAAAKIEDGRVFRRINRHGQLGPALSDQSVALIVKRRAAMIGRKASDFSGHSLRAGLATAAASFGLEERVSMRQTRHVGVTVRRYTRDGELFLQNASGRVGL
jgi:integrase